MTDLAARVADVFDGTEVAVDFGAVDRMYNGEPGINPVKLRAQILKCTRCKLHEDCKPQPSTARDVDLIILTEQPYGDEDRKVTRMMGALVDWAGLNDLNIGHVTTVACRTPDGRTPQMVEQGRCRAQMFQQMDVAGAKHILLVGAGAMRVWRNDLAVSTWHGHVGVWGAHLIVMGVQHPGALVGRRGDAAKQIRDQIVAEMKMMGELVRGEVDPRVLFGRKCGVDNCTSMLSVNYIDPDGIGWCPVHQDQGRRVWQEQRDAWNDWETADEGTQDELPF